jgi:predicted glycosyltransferase
MKDKCRNKRVLFDLNHPADFHLFKRLMRQLEESGFSIRVVARDKECLHELLESEGVTFVSRGKGRHSLAGKYLYATWNLAVLLFQLIRFRPGISMSLSSPYLALLSSITGITCITYDDTDLNPRLLPLIKRSTCLLSPATYPHKFHDRHFHLPVFKELAYLHPTAFRVEKKGKGVFFRITRTDSVHHTSGSRLELNTLINKIEALSQQHPICLSSEVAVECDHIQSVRRADPLHIHRDLAGCKAFWGNSATMAAEAAVMGIPAIFVSAEKFAYISELEAYGLLFYYHPSQLQLSLEKLEQILTADLPGEQIRESHARMLKEKIDMTAFMTWLLENLPDSITILQKENGTSKQSIEATLNGE